MYVVNQLIVSIIPYNSQKPYYMLCEWEYFIILDVDYNYLIYNILLVNWS